MNSRVRIFLAVLAVWSVSRVAAQPLYTDWGIAVFAVNSTLTDSLAKFGVKPDATSGFESQYDIPRPPRAPAGDYLEVYFPHSGGNYPPILGSHYAKDFQGPVDPVWQMSVESSIPGPTTLLWDSTALAAIEPRVELFLADLTAGSLTNMRQQSHYTFTYSSKRDFQIVGACQVNLKFLMEGFWNGATQVQDTVKAFLAGSNSPHAFADSNKLYLDNAGQGLLVFPHAPTGSYYLVVTHRNHLSVWSKHPLSLINGTTSQSSYDFSLADTSSFGSNAQKLDAGNLYSAWSGDINQDGVIDYRDRNLVWNARNQAGYLGTDCNGDGVTDNLDAAFVLQNRLKFNQHP
jgi:hypothetical protein